MKRSIVKRATKAVRSARASSKARPRHIELSFDTRGGDRKLAAEIAWATTGNQASSGSGNGAKRKAATKRSGHR